MRQLFSAKCRLASFAPSIRLDRKGTTASPSRRSKSRDTYIRKNDKFISKSVTFRIDSLIFHVHRILSRLFALLIAFYFIIN